IVTYTVTAKNAGNTPVLEATVTDNLKDVLTKATLVTGSVSATIGGAPAAAPTLDADGVLTWTGNLNQGAMVTLTYQVKVKAGLTAADTIKNLVTATAKNPERRDDPVPSTCETGTDPACSTTVTPGVPKLDVSKVSDPRTGSLVHAGQTITYTVTATNAGNTDLSPVDVKDDLSGVLSHTKLVEGSLAAKIDGTAATAPTLNATTGLLTWSGDLAAGSKVVLTYQVTVNTGLTAADTIKNHVTATAKNPERPDDPVPSTCETGVDPACSSTVTPGVPNLTVSKVSDPESGSIVGVGDTITYTITAKNSGNTPLTNVTVADDMTNVLNLATPVADSLTATIDGVAATKGIVVDTTTGAIGWVGDLAAGQTLVLRYQVTVDPNPPAGVANAIKNLVISKATDPGNPTGPVPSTCQTGTDPACSSTLPMIMIPAGPNGPMGGTAAPRTLPIILVAAALVIAAGCVVLYYRRRTARETVA
ncbi:MAG: isopeptide-forming domain-containing fimbrial protein, partial [Actinomycetia bacterium]|nr:isopeptide-forming domain-containing fimbrial protein [Actinomycetes bacterium]